MSYRYPYNESNFHQATMSPTMPGGSSNPSTPVNNPWDFDVATSAPIPAQQPQSSTPSTNLTTLHPAEFSPEELFSTPTTAAVSSPTVIRLEERVPVVPSQYHRSRIRAASGESRPRTHVQGDASSANAEQPAGPSTGTAPPLGPVRTTLTNVRAERTRPHPYRRPHSAGEAGTVPRASSAGVGKTSRSVSDQARRSPLTGENSSGLARMRFAVPCSSTLSVPLLGSNYCAGLQPAIHSSRHRARSHNIPLEGVLDSYRYSFQHRYKHHDCHARGAWR